MGVSWRAFSQRPCRWNFVSDVQFSSAAAKQQQSGDYDLVCSITVPRVVTVLNVEVSISALVSPRAVTQMILVAERAHGNAWRCFKMPPG
jgi:hypothetical protein